jgi:hypothetical protein
MKFEKNIGSFDRKMRLVAIGVIVFLHLSNQLPQAFGDLFLYVAGLFLITSIIGWDPFYLIFKMDTTKEPDKEL